MPVEVESFALLERLAHLRLTGREFREAAMEELSQLPGYDWCGVYRLESSANPGLDHAELVLDAFVGAPTEHDRIPVGKGVCGTAVASGQNQIVDDVSQLDNYLACSIETRSEIVVLVKKDETILGQIDIDSHEPGRFKKSDEHLLEGLAALMAQRW